MAGERIERHDRAIHLWNLAWGIGARRQSLARNRLDIENVSGFQLLSAEPGHLARGDPADTAVLEAQLDIVFGKPVDKRYTPCRNARLVRHRLERGRPFIL